MTAPSLPEAIERVRKLADLHNCDDVEAVCAAASRAEAAERELRSYHRVDLEGNPIFTELRWDRDTLREKLAAAERELEALKRGVEYERSVLATFDDGVPPTQAQFDSILADHDRLTFIIAEGPPGAGPREWLSEEAWEAATCEAVDDGTDQAAMRAAIDAASTPPPTGTKEDERG